MKSIKCNIAIGLSIISLIIIGIVCWGDRKYNLVSLLIALASCVPFYYTYEKRKGNIRRMVLLAVLTALAVLGRVIVVIPGFKPVTAVVTLVGMYMGSEAGFLSGSLSAVISNMFFGQGPWTPFQMLAWGICGFLAGLPYVRELLKRSIFLCLFGVVTGILYSLLMDIWTVLSFEGEFLTTRYAVAIIAALPTTLEYSISNVVFLLILRKPVGDKLERMKQKHGIF